VQGAFYRTLDAVSANNVRLELSGNSTKNSEGFLGRGLERKAVNCKKLSKRESESTSSGCARSLAAVLRVGSFGAFL
jgi:hypothetical protein